MGLDYRMDVNVKIKNWSINLILYMEFILFGSLSRQITYTEYDPIH